MGYSDAVGLARDPAFAAIWRKCCRESVPWGEFEGLPQPPGMEAGQTYALVIALQHRAGTILPFENYMTGVTGPDNWFYETVEMHRLVRAVIAGCSSGSELDLALRRLPRRTRLALRASDFAAACLRDGLETTARRVRGVWAGSVEPKGPAEQIARNLPSVLLKAAALGDRRASVGVLGMLWESLTQGVGEPEGLSRRYMVAEKKPTSLSNPDGALSAVVELLDTSRCGEINAVVRSFLIGGVFWDFDPFPWANSVTELVARALLASREGLPVLDYLPLSAAFLNWEAGGVGTANPFIGPIRDVGEGFDSTAHFTGKLRITLSEVGRLGELVKRVEASEASWRRMVEGDGRFNPRQREVLLAALEDPGARFFVAEHCRLHGVSHGTGYKDLADLEAMGFLRRQKAGRAIAYAATALLAKLVGVGHREPSP